VLHHNAVAAVRLPLAGALREAGRAERLVPGLRCGCPAKGKPAAKWGGEPALRRRAASAAKQAGGAAECGKQGRRRRWGWPSRLLTGS
jgi:hypothetical protein